tara:strand:- start:2329 stop:9483 length:7155 start_codon:yes stop_codon:yes gene_type:complete
MATGEISNYFLDGAVATTLGYRTKKTNIPFATNGRDQRPRINVKLAYDKFSAADGEAEFRSALPAIKNRAANRFLLHYFPEYYASYRFLIRDKPRSGGIAADDYDTGFRRLRSTLKDNMSARYYTSATKPATESVVVAFVSELRFALSAAEVDILKISTGQSSPIHNKVLNLRLPDPNEVVYFNTQSPTEIKTLLTLLGMMPTGLSVDSAFQLFNSDENITAGSKTTTLQIGSFMADNKAAGDGLTAYQRQLDAFEGSLPINLNFTDMQKGIFTVLNNVVTGLMRDLTDVHDAATVGGPYIDFGEADSLEITFGTTREHGDVPSKACIASIKYFVAQKSLGQQYMRIGYMTNILYNKEFSDPLILATLKNYEFLVRAMKASELIDGANLSFTDFLDENKGDFGLEGNTVWEDIPNPAAAVKDMKLREAVRLGIIDLKDVKTLEKGFEASLTSEQLERYKNEVLENPEFQKKLKIAQRNMAFSTAKDINKIIVGFLEGSPEGMGIRNNSSLGLLLRKIGIQELAMEAMICATFGLAPAFARVGSAAQSALQQAQSGPLSRGLRDPGTSIAAKAAKIRLGQLGSPVPKPPKPSIKLPKVDKKAFEPRTLDKKVWEDLKKSMLDGLMKGVLEVIKSLAALLKELCEIANPYAQDEGATDVGDLVRDNLDQNFQDAPAISNESALDQMFGNDGLTPEQVLGDGTADNRGYLSALSAILTSMEICFLFTDRSQVSDFTLEKIVDFNLSSPDPQIQQNLNTPTAVLGFFANLSRFVDITDLCNKIATDLYNANIDNICLVEEKAPELIDKILEDLAENGMVLDSPFPYNLQCPLREDYVNNPLVNSTIPDFLGAVQEAVEIEFINGLSAALQILKEPVITSSQSSTVIADSLQSCGLIGGTGAGPDQFSKFGPDLDAAAAAKSDDIMKQVTDVFATLQAKISDLDQYCDVGALLGVEGQDVVGVTDTIIKVLLNFVQQPDFINAIRDLNRRLSELSAAASSTAGLSSVATQYEFPTSFRDDFAQYIDKQSAEVDAAYGTVAPPWNGEDPDIPLSRVSDLAAQTESSAESNFGNFKARAWSSSTNPDRKYVTLAYTFPTNAVPYFRQHGFESFTLGGQQVPRFVTRLPNVTDYDTWKIMFVQGRASLRLESDLLGDDYNQRFEPLSRDYKVADQWDWVNLSMTPFASVLYSKLRRRNVQSSAQESLATVQQNPDEFEDGDSTANTIIKTTIASVLFPALYAGQTEAMFDFILKNGIFDTPRLDSLKFFFDNRGCIPDNVADLLDMGPGTNACGPSILDEVNEELLQALCHDGADPDDLNPQGTQIRDVVRHFSFLVLLQIHIAQFIVKNIFVFSAFEIDDLLTIGTIKDFMAINIRNQVQKLIETKPIVGENLVKYYNKKIQRAPVVSQGGLLDADGNVVFPPDKRFRQSDVPAIIEYMTKDRIAKSRCAVANAVMRSSDMTSPKDFDKVFVEDVLTVVPSYFGARGAGTAYKPSMADPNMIQVRQRSDATNDPENGFYNGVNMNTAAGIESLTELLDKIPSYFGGSEGVKLGSGLDAHWRGFARKMKYGKIVLERQVVYDSVTRYHSYHGALHPPDILRKTTEWEYGIEKDLFEQILFNTDSPLFANSDGRSTYTFTNLRFKYNIVYYLPSATTSAGDQPYSTNAIFGGTKPFYRDINIGETRDDHQLAGWIPLSRYVLSSLDTPLSLAASIDNVSTELTTVSSEDENGILRETTESVPKLQNLLSRYGRTVSDSELSVIVNDPVFEDYFDKSINRSVTSLVPILENFYLTTNFFPKMDNILEGAKDRCLGIYIDSLLNHMPQPPAPTVSPQALAAAGMNPEDPFSALAPSARDFILKMLIETPINILRGVAETMDPHVGITKIIRDITSAVFNEMAKGIDVSPPVRFLRDGPAAMSQDPPQTGPVEADNAPAGTLMYVMEGVPEFEFARIPARARQGNQVARFSTWLMRRTGITTRWTPVGEDNPNTGVSINELERNAQPLDAIGYYGSRSDVIQGLVEYRLSGDSAHDYARSEWDGVVVWRMRARGSTRPWAETEVLTSPTVIALLESQGVRRYNASTQGTTLTDTQLADFTAQLEADLADLPTTSILSTSSPGQTVVSEDVRILQTNLEQLANAPSPISGVDPQGVDGLFGPNTKSAVLAFQAHAAITEDGIVGLETWTALTDALAAQSQARLEQQSTTGEGVLPNLRGEDVMNLLFCLLRMGMSEAATGFTLDAPSPGIKSSPDWENFVGLPNGNAAPNFGPGYNSFAAFIGNPVDFKETAAQGLQFPNSVLTYAQGDLDPRDPRNTIPQALRDNLFPRITMDGVDFTGTFLGLLMLPPGPFGIVYLLLMLLGKELEDALTPDEDGTGSDGPQLSQGSGEQSGEPC